MIGANQTCPACAREELKPTTLAVRLPEVLKQWESVLHHPLSPMVWEEYADVSNQPLSLVECAMCGFGRFEPVVTGSSGFYDAISATDYYNAEKWEFACAVDDIRHTNAKRILDVGCGSGLFLEHLRSSIPGAELYGYDLNAELLSRLAGRGFGVLPSDPSKFTEALAGQPPFDAICLLQVLEHVANPVRFLQTFIDLLKPGGLLIVTTPNAAGPIRFFPDALTEIPPHHVTRWTQQAYRALLPRLKTGIKSVQFEPLPDYLWDSYLPVLWEERIWPAQVFDPIARSRGLKTVGERAGFAAKLMREAGIRFLHGVPGHTIYVEAYRNG
jgi:2-polyprenyl-3-methyl-5-hydroxy-6-metoxy-1,4-benzoquinol methylase